MEYEYNEPQKKSHGILAVVLGVISLIVFIFVGMIFGFFGLVPGAILAVCAIVLGIMSMRATGGRSGKGGLIIGIISLLIGLLVGGFVLAIGAFLKSDEIRENLPTLARYADDSWKGIGGVFMEMGSDDVNLDQLAAEINAYNEKNGISQTDSQPDSHSQKQDSEKSEV